MANRSLYYPYIHIRDLSWLKATLLLFEQVRRMTPPGFQTDDDKMIKPFLLPHGGRDPMLYFSDLGSERAVAEQVKLAKHLREDANDPAFLDQFGRAATEAAPRADKYGFQIHQRKLDDRLKETLCDTGLAWNPVKNEPYDLQGEYVELNERVGQAVMATLAVACAKAEGLDIVGDKRSGPLHDCLVRRRSEDVYSAWLKRRDDIAEPRQADARDLFEFVVTFTCDTTKLDAETLAKMDRAPIRRLLDVLSERAKKMDPMDPGDQRKKQFEEETNRIFEVWKNDRANMDNFWKKFFGFGLLDAGGNFLEKVVSKAVDATPAATGALFGLALQGPLLASGLGIGIGLFTHTAKTYAEWRHKDRDSPYHYLTLMEKAGVVIRADLRV